MSTKYHITWTQITIIARDAMGKYVWSVQEPFQPIGIQEEPESLESTELEVWV